nr:hypothetical protein HK105_000159 [Polyrhizophydium stewartii]
MSYAYVTEPPTRGKVVMRTTAGELEIELWPKEAPKALEGFYDNTIFHRVVKDFIVQGGDPTGTGSGGESIYGEPFADEFHSRLRFTHRGLLAMFFFTLGKTEELNRQNTIFGKIVGDTIYNLLKIGEMDVGENERPLYPPKILGASILNNPFDDIIPRTTAEERAMLAERERARAAAEEEARKPKPKKNLKLLSFAEDAEHEEDAAPSGRQKIKSLHDAIDSGPRLSKQVAVELPPRSQDASARAPASVRAPLQQDTKPATQKAPPAKRPAQPESDSDDDMSDSDDSDNGMRRDKPSATQEQIRKLTSEIRSIGKQPEKISQRTNSEKQGATKAMPGVLSVADLRKAYLSSGKATTIKQSKAAKGRKQEKALDMLQSFQSQLRSAATPSSHDTGVGGAKQASEITPDNEEWECDLHFIKGCESCRDSFGKDDDDGDDAGWMTATLKFQKPVGANVYEPRVEDYTLQSLVAARAD